MDKNMAAPRQLYTVFCHTFGHNALHYEYVSIWRTWEEAVSGASNIMTQVNLQVI